MPGLPQLTLDSDSLSLARASYAPTTFRNYSTQWKALLEYLSLANIPEKFPLPPHVLLLYISHLARSGKAVSTIKSTVAAIATIHNLLYDTDPTKNLLISRSLKGLEKVSKEPSSLLPITRDLLASLLARLDFLDLPRFDTTATKAIFALAYMGCFRIGELVFSESGKHTAKLENFSILKFPAGKELRILLPSFKHHSAPASITIKESKGSFCAIKLLENYLSIRPKTSDYLFLDKKGRPYNRGEIAKTLKRGLRNLVPSTKRYNTHSLRIGRTSDLVRQGAPESIIQQTGRWKSLAYRSYFRVQNFQMPE